LNSYVVDAWAWIEYLIGSECGAKLNEIFEDEDTEVYTCAVTVAEVVSKVAKEGKDVEVAYSLLLSNSQIVNVDEELSKSAGLAHAEMKQKEKDFSLADSYVLATARKLKTKILTGDPHFKNVTNAVLIK
jgi:predicted nucleic acid-binding protein